MQGSIGDNVVLLPGRVEGCKDSVGIGSGLNSLV